MKSPKTLLRSIALLCACICFPALLHAYTATSELNFDVKTTTVCTENVAFSQSSEANADEYTAVEMGKKQKTKRKRHRKISHMR
ncbi:MAG: hypothetical protein LBR55_02420 [Bacteroidales bacterium]|jgi:hypothetical protein|nr:hypothetical protein [Bacteroidales bacterium]